MEDIFYLNHEVLPNLPCPHDCIIKEVKLEDELLTFMFEADISYHDSTNFYNPKAKTLITKYHLLDKILVYQWRRHKFCRNGSYHEVKPETLSKMVKENLVYIDHYVGFSSVILKLYNNCGEIVVELSSDCIEYEWIE